MCGDEEGPLHIGSALVSGQIISSIGGKQLHFKADADFIGTVDSVTCLSFTDLTTDGAFSTGMHWNKSSAWSIYSGTAHCNGSQTEDAVIYQFMLEANTDYKITYTVLNRTAGSIKTQCGETPGTARNTDGTYTETINSGSGDDEEVLWFVADTDFIGEIDNVYCQVANEDPGVPYPYITKGIYWVGNNLVIESINTTIDASGNLTASNVTLSGTIEATAGKLEGLTVTGDLNVTSGHIRAGATAYDNGTGFWLGYDGGPYKFFIGNSTGSKLTFDGTTLSLSGVDGAGITNINGGNIQTGSIYATQIHSNTILAGNIATNTITANEIAGNTITGDKLNLNSYLAIKSATYGADGIQLQYNGGNPRAYIGNGSSNYFKFDGTNTYMSGTIYATGGSITGTLNISGSGKLTVGTDVELSTGGLIFKSGTGNAKSINWMDGSYHTGWINSYDDGTWNRMTVRAGNLYETKAAELRLEAEEAGNGTASIVLRARDNSDDSSVNITAGYSGGASSIEVRRNSVEIWGTLKVNGVTMNVP